MTGILTHVPRLVGLAVVGAMPLLLGNGAARASLAVSASTDAAAMAAALLGPGANLVTGSASYVGAAGASGFFTGDTSIFGDPVGVEGVLLTSGSVVNALPPNNSGSASTNNDLPGSSIVPGTLDGSTLTFKITLDPDTKGLEWKYVFGSEEYNEFVGSGFNDAFSLTLNGTNLALIPSTTTPVSINNVNLGLNSAFYRNNSPGTIQTQYDGLTTVLTATALGLTPGAEYTLAFGIGDRGDRILDSGVFILGGSIRDPDQGPTDAVPGPLSILGAGAAFGWSRRLRRRLSSGQHTTN